MRKILAGIFFLTSLIHADLFGQTDTSRIDPLDDYLFAYLWTGAPSFTIDMDSIDRENTRVDYSRQYEHNSRNLIGVAFGYRKIFISLAVKTPYTVVEEYPDIKSKSFSFNLNYRTRGYILEFSYKNHKGFYDPTVSKVDTIQTKRVARNDMMFRYLKLKGYYFFKPEKFSYNASFLFKEWQKRSGGSLFVYGNFWNGKLQGDSAFLPEVQIYQNPSWARLNKMIINSAGVAGGYAFSIVMLKRLFISGMVSAGLEAQYQQYDYLYDAPYRDKVRIGPVLDSRAAFGFNSRRFFMAITVKNDVNVFRHAGIRNQTTYNIVYFNIGYRFLAPKLVCNAYDKSPFVCGLGSIFRKKK